MNYRLTVAAAAGTVLASTALYALFVGMEWFWAGVGAVIVVAAVGLATRIRRLPVVVCVAAGLAGLLLYLNLLFAPGQSWFAIIPNAASLTHVWHVATAGMTDADRFSPPVPITTGLLLLSTAGIGLAAVAADVLAARVRSSAVAGLPLLALFIAPSTTPAGRSGWGTALVFFLGTVGYLVILAADGRDRIGRWGRTVGLWRADRYGRPDTGRTPGPGSVKTSDVSTLASAGRRIGMVSIVVALCVPLFIPGLQVNRMFPAHVNVFGPGGNGLGGGSGGIGPDPLAQMTQDLHEGEPESVLTYTTTDPDAAVPADVRAVQADHHPVAARTARERGRVGVRDPAHGPGADPGQQVHHQHPDHAHHVQRRRVPGRLAQLPAPALPGHQGQGGREMGGQRRHRHGVRVQQLAVRAVLLGDQPGRGAHGPAAGPGREPARRHRQPGPDRAGRVPVADRAGRQGHQEPPPTRTPRPWPCRTGSPTPANSPTA